MLLCSNIVLQKISGRRLIANARNVVKETRLKSASCMMNSISSLTDRECSEYYLSSGLVVTVFPGKRMIQLMRLINCCRSITVVVTPVSYYQQISYGDFIQTLVNKATSMMESDCATVRGDKLLMRARTNEKLHTGAVDSNTRKQRTFKLKQSGQALTVERNSIFARSRLSFHSNLLQMSSPQCCLSSNDLGEIGLMTLTMMNSNQPRLLSCEQIMTSSEQSNDVSQTETEITSDSISSLFLYKGEVVKDLKEMQNVENSFSGSNEQYAEIVRLKETLFEQVQEKDSLMKTVSDLKNDLKMEENKGI
ncbi:hypothetical protein Tco_0191322 [Tanacetum coccineum]